MNIVHIISSFTGGGAERFVVSLCNELSNDETLNVHIISLFDIEPNMFLQHKVSTKVKIHTLSKNLGFDLKIFFKLSSLVKSLSADIVHTHLRAFNYNFFNLLFYKKPKYFHTVHSDAFLECPSAKNRKLRRVFYKRHVTPVTISEESSASFKAVYKLNNDVLIYNGRESIAPTKAYNNIKLEIEAHKKDKHTKIFLSIANLLPVKNHENLVKAFKKVINSNANAILLLIGDRRPNDDGIFKIIKAHEGPQLKYLGVKQNVEDYLLCSDAFIMTSHIEGMPITLIEALSAGCIPIVTPVGGMANMITHHSNGLLTKDTSVDAIYNTILSFLNLENKTKANLKANCQLVYNTKFSIKKSAKEYHSLYKKLVNKKPTLNI